MALRRVLQCLPLACFPDHSVSPVDRSDPELVVQATEAEGTAPWIMPKGNKLPENPEEDSKISLSLALDKLRNKASLGAISNAEERAYAPRCLHETRTRVLDDLGEWSAAQGRWKDVTLLVLTGPAGHGKTAIMQSFSEQLLRKSGGANVVATFFFKATIPEQSGPKNLVTTLAYQLAERCPSIRARVLGAILEDLKILSKSLEYQMEHLLVMPLSDVHDSTPGHFTTGAEGLGERKEEFLVNPIANSQVAAPCPPPTLICAVDGLDECDGDQAQSRVIRLLHTLSKSTNTRVILASRPEFPIQSVIKFGLSGMLHIDLNKDYNARDDIHRFAWIRLLDIRERLLPSIDRASWPREVDAEQIADYSSGQFILAGTAMRYVDDRRYDPRTRLEEFLTWCGGVSDPSATGPEAAGRRFTRPLSTLDALFTGILERAAQNTYPDLEPERGVLELASLVWILIRLTSSGVRATSIFSRPSDPIPLWLIEEGLNRQSGDLARELSDLHSLLDVPQDMHGRHGISAHHKSFVDFLGDPRRSGHLGNIPQVAEELFDPMIKAHLSSLTVDELKNLMSAQPVKPHILHQLHLLYDPKTVIESIEPRVWKSLIHSLNAWDTLLLREWVSVGLSEGALEWNLWNSHTLQMMDEACKGRLHDLLFPGTGNEGPADPPPMISDPDIDFLLMRLDSQGDDISGRENFAFIPEHRTTWTRQSPAIVTPSFPWFPACRALAWLWAPNHRRLTGQSRVASGTPNSHPQEPSRIVFIIGSVGSGKRELLEETYGLLPAGEKDGPPERRMPPVDIIIIADRDGLSFKSLWIRGFFTESCFGTPCSSNDLIAKIDLSREVPPSLFQDCIASWKAKHENNTYHPQFLLQGLDLLSPDYQGKLLDLIASDAGPSHSTGRPPLFVTLTSLPTATLVDRLRRFSWPGAYYLNLDGMAADVSLLEGILSQRGGPSSSSPLKIHKVARILASSPMPARHLKRLIDQRRIDPQWENHLNPVLDAPEPEAWRVIEEHFGDISSALGW